MLNMIRTIAATALFSAASVWAGDYEAGVHYKVLDEPQPVAVADEQILVEEAFWYGCPHCYDLEDNIQPWKSEKADDVVFKGVPAMFGRAWTVHAQLYYTAEVLGVLPKVHDAIFEAIHLKKQRLLSEGEQKALMVTIGGVSPEDFDKAYNSFTVKTRMSQGDQRVRNFKIDGVPALIVNGKYVVTGKSAGSEEEMINVMNHLIEKERAALTES